MAKDVTMIDLSNMGDAVFRYQNRLRLKWEETKTWGTSWSSF
jgi:hypothetical protein